MREGYVHKRRTGAGPCTAARCRCGRCGTGGRPRTIASRPDDPWTPEELAGVAAYHAVLIELLTREELTRLAALVTVEKTDPVEEVCHYLCLNATAAARAGAEFGGGSNLTANLARGLAEDTVNVLRGQRSAWTTRWAEDATA